MTTSKKLLIGTLFLLCSPLFAVILWIGVGMTHGLALRIAGYEVDVSPKELAEEIYAERGSVERCKNIAHALPTMGPSADDDKMRCVFEYASLAKDPSACELLMPSSYGWDCLGAAKESNARMCWFDFGKNAKRVGENTMPECGGSPDLADRCCSMAADLFVERVQSCDQFSDIEILHNQCLEELAHREKNIDLCEGITNKNVQVTCEVAVRALQNQ